MPREIALFGVYVPIMSLLFLWTLALAWALDRWLSALDAYRFFWHPALLRLCLFFCLFGALALIVYR